MDTSRPSLRTNWTRLVPFWPREREDTRRASFRRSARPSRARASRRSPRPSQRPTRRSTWSPARGSTPLRTRAWRPAERKRAVTHSRHRSATFVHEQNRDNTRICRDNTHLRGKSINRKGKPAGAGAGGRPCATPRGTSARPPRASRQARVAGPRTCAQSAARARVNPDPRHFPQPSTLTEYRFPLRPGDRRRPGQARTTAPHTLSHRLRCCARSPAVG